jgi:DNA-binding LacI/PurR family transcriptional regulator
MARSLRTKRTNVIQLAYMTTAESVSEDGILHQVLESTYDALHRRHYDLLFTTFDHIPSTASLLRRLGSLCDGMLFNAIVYDKRSFAAIRKHPITIMGMLAPQTPSVSTDRSEYTRMIVGRLISRGHRRFCLLTPVLRDKSRAPSSTLQILQAYKATVAAANGEPAVIWLEPSWKPEDLARELRPLGRIDSIFVASGENYDSLATVLKNGAINTGDDFEVILGRDYGRSLDEKPPFSVTEILTDWREIAKRAVEKMVNRLEGRDEPLWDKVEVKVDDKFSSKKGLLERR